MAPGSAWSPRKTRDNTDTRASIHERTAGRSLIFLKILVVLSRMVKFNNILSQKQRQMVAPLTEVLIPAVIFTSWGSLEQCPETLPGCPHSIDNEVVRTVVSQHPTIPAPNLGSFRLYSSSWPMRVHQGPGWTAGPQTVSLLTAPQ